MKYKNGTRVQEKPEPTKFWLINLILTLIFIPVHLFIVGVVFFSYLHPAENWPTYLWSAV